MKHHSAWPSVSVRILAIGLLSTLVMTANQARGQTTGNPPSFLFKWGSLCQLTNPYFGDPGTLQGCVDPDGAGPLQLGDGQLQSPGRLVFDTQGNLYVIDHGNNRIQKFDRNGRFITKWGSYCDMNGEFGVVGRGCVDPDGAGPLQLGDGQFLLNFAGGVGIATDSHDNVYVVDQGNNRIQVFDSNGNFLRKWGGKCPARWEACDGLFLTPRDIAIDRDDFVYVYDGGRSYSDIDPAIIDRVQKFDAYGNQVLKFQACGPFTGLTCNTPNYITALNGWALATDSQNNVYVLNSGYPTISKFSSAGSPLAYFTISQLLGVGVIGVGEDIAINSNDEIYVRGILNGIPKVAVLNTNGQALLQFAQGSGPNDLRGGGGIAIDPQSNNVYLSDNTYLSNVNSYLPEIKVWGNNSAPLADAGGPYNVNEGGSVTVTASGSDPENGPLTYAWDLDNNGSFETPGLSVNFSAAGLDGTSTSSRTIQVQVTDNGGLTATAQATVNVVNVAPTATFTATPSTIVVGQSATLAFSNPFDPSAADVAAGFKYSFDCKNDGSFEVIDATAPTNSTCSYPTSGTYTAKGRIKDKDGGFTDYTVQVKVQTPREATGSLIDQIKALVNAGVLNQGQGNGLIAKLEGVIKQLEKGNTKTAINELQAFINQVNDFMNSTPPILTPAQGQPLIDAANAITAALRTTAKAAQLNSGSSGLMTTTEGALPTGYRLEQNSPNPFNPVTTIQFAVPRESYVRLKVYNSFGAEVTTLVDQQVAAGTYKVNWDASQLASGFYLYRLEAEGFAQTKKLLLMK